MADEIELKDKEIIERVPLPESEPVDLSAENPVQAEIDIDLKEKQKAEKTRVNSRDNSFLKKIIDTPKEQPGGGSSTDDIKRRLSGESQPLSSSGTINDSVDSDGTAELIVEILDWLLVEGITWYSMADSSRDYETDKEKKKVLKKYFAKWLQKKSANYPVEYFLFAAFISTYLISARRAYQDRKINEPIKKAKEKARRADSLMTSERKRRKIKDDLPFTPTEEVK